MAQMKDFDIRLRNGGDDAVAAANELCEILRLTDAEMEAVEAAVWRFEDAINGFDDADRAAALRGLLERLK